MEKAIVGDVVRLNSGSPALTIIRVNNGTVDCIWLCEEKFEQGNFPLPCVYKDEFITEQLRNLLA
jgi:uncharacterized protein YodC (DUF2158 family)